MTQREIQTLKALQSWNRRRDERLARMERMGGVQKFFPDIPDYNDKEVPGGKQTPKRSHKKKPPKDDSLGDAHDTIGTLSLTYRQDPNGVWDYVVSTADGEILTKGGPYRDSPQCKRHARRQAHRYLAGIPLDTGKRRIAIMANKEEEFYEGPFRFKKDSRGEWRFSLLGENGEVMFQSEAYFNRGNARRGAKRIRERLLGDQEKK